MLNIIRYEELTWPEVVDLPRDIAFILQLGDGYGLSDIGQVIDASTLCVLPNLPYGWEGSVAPVSTVMLKRVINAIFDGLREQGFTNFTIVYAGDAILAENDVKQITKERSTIHDPKPLAATQQRVILIPCGHTEQHGYHLPLNTDTVIIGAIANGTTEEIPEQAETLPTLPY
ncbi:MAG: creatininase family protein, partial [Chloroflexota bacterium]